MKSIALPGHKDKRQKEKGKRQKRTRQFLPFAFYLLPFILVWPFIQISTLLLVANEKLAQLKASVDNTNITVGDILQLNLEIKRPKAAGVAFPTIGPQLKDWIVRDSVRSPSKENEPGWFSESLRLQLTIYKTGDFEIPLLEVEVVHSNGEKQVLTSDPIKIKVQSVLSGDQEQLKGIKAQADIPADYKPFLLLLAALGALALIIYRAIHFFKNRKGIETFIPEETRSPEEIAREVIRALLARKLVQKGYLKEFYLELSEIVKRYLGLKLGVPSLERTTEEFSRDLRETAVSWEEFQLIKEFLMDCDLVKFAKYRPSEEEIDRIVQRSFDIIDATEANKKTEFVSQVAQEVSK